jgi:hypothetical protein
MVLAMQRLLAGTAAVHLLLALIGGGLLLVEAPQILGAHPALKPTKFALSIGVFLATAAVLMPRLSLSPLARALLAGTLSLTMIVEMAAVATQAARGNTSHFNVATPLDHAIWSVMGAAIVVASVAMLLAACVATWRPLLDLEGRPLPPALALGWRAGLWIFQLSALTGFLMAGRSAHSVGGSDGGPGLPLVNWSSTHGDLRVSHFVSLHAWQLLPLLAWLALRAPLGPRGSVALVAAASVVLVGLCLGALVQAQLGRPVL